MEELVTCEGTVHSIIFQNAENGYTVLRLLTEEGEVITVVGCIPCVAPGEHLAVSGVPETHPQHGEQLRAVELERSLPEDEEEIFSYLSSGICKGVGPATARRIVERFGAETLDVLEREPERLTTLKGVTARKAQEIAESFRRHMGLRRLMAFLAQYQLPPVLAMELRRQYGDAALEKVRENPYLLSGEACGVEFSVTDGIAMGMGLAADSDLRLQAAVTFELSHNENNGHVFLPRNKLISATTQLLDSGAELVEQALDSLIERGAVVQEQVAHVEACYLRRLWEAECSACIRLAGLLAADTDRSAQAGRAVDELEAQQGITYAPLQRQAVELAARTGVLVLTGGPGTGKTTTCENLGIGLAMEGKKVLLVDADPQGSLTISMGWQQPDELPTTLSTLMQKAMNDQSIPPGEGILHHAEGVDLIPANIELAGMEVSLVNCMNREKMLKQVLEGAKHEYDFILLDCTPSLGMLTVNALAAADTTLIPVQAQYLSAKGLEQLLQTVQKVRRQINPKLKIEGILLTMTDSRTNYGQQIDNLIRGAYGSKIKVFDQTIPRSVRAAEISAVGKSIFQHDPKGKVAEAYKSLTEEVMANAEKQLKRVAERGR